MNRVAFFTLLLSIGLLTKSRAQEIEDPFSNGEFAIGSSEHSEIENDVFISWSFLGLYEQGTKNDSSVLNSNYSSYIEKNGKLQFEVESKLDVSEQIKINGRWFIQQESQVYLDSNEDLTNTEDELLEGYLRWSNRASDLNVLLGRVKPVWSNGFNWNPANLLYPYYERPHFDEDKIQQQQGWDMVQIEKLFESWSFSALVADFSSRSFPESKFQSALRFAVHNGWDGSIILYNVDGQEIDSAVTFSSLINDAATLRLEWARQHHRELEITQNSEATYNNTTSYWEKSVVGVTTRLAQNWDLSLEYLYNQHGLSNLEWDNVYKNMELANFNIENGNLIAESVVTLTNTSQMFELGQLRRNYLYLSFADNQDTSFWQYKQSVQVNLDDDSRLHRLQLIHNWTPSFNTKLQFEIYEGCDSCEFGLLPSQRSIRLSFYYRN